MSAIEDLRKEANAILKGVDQLIKAGNLDAALTDIARAKVIDPRNAYIYAFEERISVLREELEKKRNAVAARAVQEDEAKKRLEEARVRLSQERQQKELEAKKKLEQSRGQNTAAAASVARPAVPAAPPRTATPIAARPAQTSPTTKPALQVTAAPPSPAQTPDRKKIEEEARRSFEEEFHKANQQQKLKSESAAVSPVKDSHSMYKRVLLLVWADGAVTKEEETQLREMREAFSISDEEHHTLERECRLESYAQAFKLVWTGGKSTKERAAVVSELRRKFLLSPDEQQSLEAKIIAGLGPSEDHTSIVVIEDEDTIREVIVKILEMSGFAVRAFSTSEEAFTALRSSTADLILSDVNLESSAMGGFSFYEKVRQLHHLDSVPFIFLSGMSDEGMIRYGKVLGADDYLTKPFSNDMLVDTIKGKLKRYKLLQRKPSTTA